MILSFSLRNVENFNPHVNEFNVTYIYSNI